MPILRGLSSGRRTMYYYTSGKHKMRHEIRSESSMNAFAVTIKKNPEPARNIAEKYIMSVDLPSPRTTFRTLGVLFYYVVPSAGVRPVLRVLPRVHGDIVETRETSYKCCQQI